MINWLMFSYHLGLTSHVITFCVRLAFISPIAIDVMFKDCLSDTFVHCAQTAEDIDMIYFAYDNPMSLPNFTSVLWHCWLGLLTCKTVSQITYRSTVLVETLNPAHTLKFGLHQTTRPPEILPKSDPPPQGAPLNWDYFRHSLANCRGVSKVSKTNIYIAHYQKISNALDMRYI